MDQGGPDLIRGKPSCFGHRQHRNNLSLLDSNGNAPRRDEVMGHPVQDLDRCMARRGTDVQSSRPAIIAHAERLHGVLKKTARCAATAPFSNELQDADAILAALAGEGPRTSFGTLQVGFEARLGTRIGFSWFLETIPSLAQSPNLGSYVRIGPLEAHSMGAEATFCF